ncbi:hypothetical protein [Sphingomonas daechungensis]|uniref:hypothetical protein n=1 Tax=Sphingomonas daechungensis TaxID=1176646 RepID=UPI003784CA67
MIASVLAVALVAQNPVTVVDTTRGIEIPQSIFPAVQPYINCLLEQSNEQLKAMGGATEEKFPEIKRVAIEKCRSIRAMAMAEALAALEKSEVHADVRPEYVEQTLISLENQMLDAPQREEPTV